MLPPYPPSLLSARGGAPERRGAPAPGNWDAAASPKTRALCGARSRPLPLAARPFPFLPLLLRFHPHPSPSLRELAGHPPAVHLVPFTPRVKEWGANWDVDLCCWRVSCLGGSPRKALAVDFARESGMGVLWPTAFCPPWSETIGFSLHLSSLEGHRCREVPGWGVRTRRNSAFLFWERK